MLRQDKNAGEIGGDFEARLSIFSHKLYTAENLPQIILGAREKLEDLRLTLGVQQEILQRNPRLCYLVPVKNRVSIARLLVLGEKGCRNITAFCNDRNGLVILQNFYVEGRSIDVTGRQVGGQVRIVHAINTGFASDRAEYLTAVAIRL